MSIHTVIATFNFKEESGKNTFLDILKGETIEHLLSEKQLELWNWILSLDKKEFSRKDAIEATGFPARTVEAIIKKLFDLKKLERIGEGRGIRYRVLKN